ncbi:SDR family NAD(P)-dependent oxidoreductase [Roseateles sp.]|uniref:SDR family NAD(P)-dependent oxidoreductase n=1 Tax=Roseateles sp. TaxID=1971397 RepID=UPI002E0376AD|nr:SDR family NAD(P)-dependent oxidoreductase [Roseateles sp.]
MKMQGNTILLAVGMGGVGRGLAELLCRMGNEVVLFGAPGTAREAAAHAHPGLRILELDLADPWSVAAFADGAGAACPGLNLLVNVSVAFPARYLPGMQLLMHDDTPRRLEAHRLGLRHLTGCLLPQLRRQAGGGVINVCAGPALAPPAMPPMRDAMEGGLKACTVSVSKRWASAWVEAIAVGPPAREPGSGMALAPFASGLAQLLAQGLHEDAVLARLRTFGPAASVAAARPAPARAEDEDDLVAEPS